MSAVNRIPLIWIVLGDVTSNRGMVVRVFSGEGAGDKADRFARLRRDRDVIYRPASEDHPLPGTRITRESWSGPRGAS